MHQHLYAAHRLIADLEQPVDIEAQFDGSRESDLRRIQAQLRKHQLLYSLGQHHLFHKSNNGDIGRESEQTAEVLNGMGYELRILPGIYNKSTFALRGRDGLVVQKVQSALRIFFSI
jgi:hypothetical protein